MLEMRVPGDKSIAHRAVVLGALAVGESSVAGVSAARDVAATIDAMRALGARLTSDGETLRIQGAGAAALTPPADPIDCANSGTTARMLMGVAAALPGETVLTGDASLRRRPMERVAAPLRDAGARIDYLEGHGVLPVRIRGGRLDPIIHRSDVASAQVKSALLLAGIAAGVDVSVVEPVRSRDHTERMLRAMGAEVDAFTAGDGLGVLLRARAPLTPIEGRVPGDFSSAAFLLVAALLGAAPVRVTEVGVNPTRTGFLDVIQRMGGTVGVERPRVPGWEPVADLEASPARLTATRVDAAEAVRLIDELPLVAVLGAHAEGDTHVRGAAELRTKESDRIRAVCENLRTLGVDVHEHPDGFTVRGGEAPLEGRVHAFGDHRIAMAFTVLGARPGSRIEVDDQDVAAVSYPGFTADMQRLAAAGSASEGTPVS